ncbi:MAG: Fic family protein [Gemmatimonadaceae bacterium]
MKRGATGRYVSSTTVGQRAVRAFIPRALPPHPPLSINAELRDRLDAALLSLGRLDSVSTLLPDTSFFLYTYVRKEAVLSSQIEGTQSSLSDLLLFEAEASTDVPLDDVTEVSNYVGAMQHGLRRIKEGFPVSNRLIREMHSRLLSRGRGSAKNPGEFRTTQNWLGSADPSDTVFVPPPPNVVPDCMSDLERWVHDKPDRTPTLIKAALAHVQFETIHPFLDGNGRIGRLLITLLLCAEGVLDDPLLYLSLYLKKHRRRYYALLDSVRTEGNWEEWLAFFADGVNETAGSAVKTAQRLVALASGDRDRIRSIRRAAGSALRVHHALQERPVATTSQLAAKAKLSIPTVIESLRRLEDLKIVNEVTGRERYRVYTYEQYLGILSEGTEPL